MYPATRLRGPAPASRLVATAFHVALAAVAAAALLSMNWLAVAPNRLMPGVPETGPSVLGATAYLLAAAGLVAALAEGLGRAGARAAAALAGCALLAAAWLTGEAAAARMATQPAIARASLGGGFWVVLGCLSVLAFQAAREAGRWARLALSFSLIAGFLLLARAGAFDSLSLAVEYAARSAVLGRAALDHLTLAAGALLLAVGVAAPLGWLAFRHRLVETVAGSAFGAVQVVPAIALFGLLVSLLSLLLAAAPGLRAYGIGAIGETPALLAVAAYLTLPVFRSTISGLASASPAAVESARAMGMTEAGVTREIRLPLGLPVFIGGLRVAAVQAIGLVTLGGLIGAGGLGAIVFEGMSQFAEDLIVLAAAPIVGLAIVADGGLRALERALGGTE